MRWARVRFPSGRGCAALALCLAMVTNATGADTASDAWTYQITLGDTLIGISGDMLERPDDWPKLQQSNRIANPRRLPSGGTIRIPMALLKRSATVASVIFVRGDATLKRTPTDPERPDRQILIGDGVGTQDVIQTGRQSSVSLRFADGSRLMIGPDSQVRVVRLLLIGRAALPDSQINLERGDAEIHIVPNAGRRFELRTPAMNLGVRGTRFRAHVDSSGAGAGVEVIDGRVGAEALRSEVPVDGGFGTLAEAGKPVAPPRLLLPPPELTGITRFFDRLPLQLAWPPVAGAVAYRAQILAIADDDQLLMEGRFAQASAQWADLPDGRYRLRVRGVDASGLEGLDSVEEIVIKARPVAPLAKTPPPEAASIGAATRFEWAGAVDATAYRLQIARDAAFTDIVFDNASLAQPGHEIELVPGAYHWRVASVTKTPDGRDDVGPFGAPQRFVQRLVPPRLDLMQPEVDRTTVRLRWAPTRPGQRVRLQIGVDAQFNQLELDRYIADASELIVEVGPGEYVVRAQIIDADGLTGDFGSVQPLSVPTPSMSPWWWFKRLGL